jgi:hydroxymethylbilane synthase
MRTLRLGTRGSPLALFQAHSVARLLEARAGAAIEIAIIRTSGDRLADARLSEVGGKRLFVKEIEEALLAREIDIAVHSSKDLPADLPAGLTIGAVLPREDARDAVILPGRTGTAVSIAELTARLGGAGRIGTSSVRRMAQLARLFPGARFLPIRGNLDTRLRKLDENAEFDAIVLAAAGLERLEQHRRISARLPVDACVPAPGQGIIAVEVRTDDADAQRLLTAIDDAAAAAALTAERAVVTRLGGGCQMPLGAHAAAVGAGALAMTAVVLSLDGARLARVETRGAVSAAHAVGVDAAEQLLTRGAGEILEEARRAQAGRAS